MNVPSRARSTGLDTLRAVAVTLVFMYHYMVFVSGQPTFGWASEVGWTGVDLFFVLSGYLIANQLFKGIAEGRAVSLKRFSTRRAFRTLPAFWLVLAAYFLFPESLGGREPPALWRFLTFTQNYELTPGTAFSHAWSLCIEEQFYVALPLVLIIGARLARGRKSGWLLMASLTVLGVAARAILWRTYGLQSNGHVDGYTSHIYYATLCRFDELIPGIAVAMLKNFHKPLWENAMARGRPLFALGLGVTGVLLTIALKDFYIDGYGYGLFMTAFGYTLLAWAFALLVASALSPVTLLNRLQVPGLQRIALWSYSIYLSHKAVAHVIKSVLAPASVSESVRLGLIASASIATGALLYTLIEAPFIALRDRWFPSNFGESYQ